MRTAPAVATWLLEQSCSDAEHESVTGDLLEQYHLGRSRVWYWWQVLLIVFVRLSRNRPRRPRVSKVRWPLSVRMIAPLSFFLMVVIVATSTREPDLMVLLIHFGIFFSFLGLEIVRFWHKLHPQIQALNIANRKHAVAAPHPSVVVRPLGLPL
jgi:hypothetical protein